jgi:hypothetical protein
VKFHLRSKSDGFEWAFLAVTMLRGVLLFCIDLATPKRLGFYFY